MYFWATVGPPKGRGARVTYPLPFPLDGPGKHTSVNERIFVQLRFSIWLSVATETNWTEIWLLYKANELAIHFSSVNFVRSARASREDGNVSAVSVVAVVVRRRSGPSYAGWGCRTVRSAADRPCTDKASRPSECAGVSSASNCPRTSSCTVDSGTAAPRSVSGDESSPTSSDWSCDCRPGSGKVFRHCVYVREPSGWPPVRTTCGRWCRRTVSRRNAFSCESWACSGARTTCRRYDTRLTSRRYHHSVSPCWDRALVGWWARGRPVASGSQAAWRRSYVDVVTLVRLCCSRTAGWRQTDRLPAPPSGTDADDGDDDDDAECPSIPVAFIWVD